MQTAGVERKDLVPPPTAVGTVQSMLNVSMPNEHAGNNGLPAAVVGRTSSTAAGLWSGQKGSPFTDAGTHGSPRPPECKIRRKLEGMDARWN